MPAYPNQVTRSRHLVLEQNYKRLKELIDMCGYIKRKINENPNQKLKSAALKSIHIENDTFFERFTHRLSGGHKQSYPNISILKCYHER